MRSKKDTATLAAEMAACFDSALDPVLTEKDESDYDTNLMQSKNISRKFEQTVEDVRDRMEKNNTNFVPIVNDVQSSQTVNNQEKDITNLDEQSVKLVEKVIQSTKKEVKKETVKEENEHNEHNLQQKTAKETEKESKLINLKNPFNLTGELLKDYEDILNSCPDFYLFNGNPEFLDFYHYKFMFLSTTRKRFKFLNFKALHKELSTIRLDHYLSENIANPMEIRVQISESYAWRIRLASILVQVFEQIYIWERWIELLRSKLFKDHSQRGAHNRDGLALEHMSDIEMYVADMQGFIESAKHWDNMLKAASDSLSRQLTCIQLEQQQGLTADPAESNFYKNVLKKDTVMQKSSVKTVKEVQKNEDDDIDGIESGTVISAPKSTGAVSKYDFGVADDDDEFATLG